MQIVLAHTSVGPFVQQTARALYETQMLRTYATGFVAREDAAWQAIGRRLGRTIGIDVERLLQRRAVTEVPMSCITEYPFPEFLRTVVSRWDKDGRIGDMVYAWVNQAFDRWVAHTQIAKSDGVYGYEFGCLETFKIAKQHGLACIYEVPSPEHDFVERIFEQEFAAFPELRTPYYQYTKKLQAKRTQRRHEEWALADVVIANSKFTKNSYEAAGLSVDKVKVIPLGAPPVCPERVVETAKKDKEIRFLWAGNFAIHKGAHYLLAAWQKAKPTMASLDIFGTIKLPDALLRNLPDSIHFAGVVSRAELYEVYRQADVLICPSLFDGFGMVVTEAFAQGLPVITTKNVGAADLVIHKKNGLIIPTSSVEALVEAIEWCIAHPSDLRSMRRAAWQTAESWQWSDYRRAFIENLGDGLQAAGYRP